MTLDLATYLGSASLWGCDLSWDDIRRTDGTGYLEEVTDDLISEAIDDARTSLARLQEG